VIVRIVTAGVLVCGAPLLARAQVIVDLEAAKIPVSPNREDVKAIGMGRTGVADGKWFNGMMYNPALLARTRTRVDVIGVEATLPQNSLDAATFLRDNQDQFKTGDFIKQISGGVQAYLANGATDAQKAAAIRRINDGLSFINQFQEKVLGPADNPKTQGVAVTPSVQVQVGNLGISLHATANSAFQSFPGEALSRLYALRLPENLETLTAEQALDLLGILSPLLDQNGQLKYEQAIPTTFAVSYLDIVGTVGYGYQVTPDLAVGANLKVVNRRVSTRIIASDNFSSIISELRKDFQGGETGVTLDLGALYRLKSTGTEFGLSLQNIIPLPKSTGVASLNSIVYDANLNPVPVTVRIPVEFSSPFLVNLAATHPITPQWDASFDWVDIAAQDDKHASYTSRFRVGTEYRLDALPEVLGIAFRAGVTDRKFAAGFGLNLFRVLQIDGAYARENFVDDNAYYAQVRLGW
jgi:hypothetical protein